MINIFSEGFKSELELVEPVSKTVRYYQGNTVNDVADALEAGDRRIQILSPTGTGKTFISKLICLSSRVRKALNVPDGEQIKVMFISHRGRINRQTEAEFYENKSIKFMPQMAGSDILPEILKEGFHIALIDECHHEAMISLQMRLEDISKSPIIGLTADDKRADGLLLKFETVISSISEKEAAEKGFIAKAGINTILDSGVLDKSRITVDLIKNYQKHMGNTIIFVRTESEANKIQRALSLLGNKVASIKSDTSEVELDERLDDLSNGKIQYLINMKKIGEGVDVKNVTDVILARRFNSSAEKKQFVGRAIRPDCACAVWELIDPVKKSVATKDIVGAIKYERILYTRDNKWNERLISGEDPTWGQVAAMYNH